jgi:secreted PhoX family phosphatase
MSQSIGKLSRRTLFAGAGTAGAIAAATAVVPRVASQAAPAAEPKRAPERGGGYQLSEHVKRYYKTTLI